MSENAIQDILSDLAEGHNLSQEQAARAFQIIMNAGATPAQMGAFLLGLRVKGETVDEITAGAQVLRMKAPKVTAPAGAIDTCGTGGDAKGTLNISTAVAFVVAGCGVPVVKHGNRGVSSQSGSADVLAELGVNLKAEIPVLERALAEAGICFLMAPQFHSAMRHVAPVRQELALRTVFNLLGPLANPAAPRRQLLGVYSPRWLEPLAMVLHKLGVEQAWVVHGEDGMDELSISGASQVVEMRGGELRRFIVTPEEAGLEAAPLEAIKGADPRSNAMAMQDVLLGAQGAYRTIVLLNAAAALIVAGKAHSLEQGVAIAADAIEQGRAMAALRKLVEITNG